MLGILGILGCVWAVAVCAGAGLALSGYGAYQTYKSGKEQQAHNEEMMQMQQQQNAKADNRGKADKLRMERQQEANVRQTRRQLGSAIAFNQLVTERNGRKAAKKEHEGERYSKGKPVTH